MTVQLIQLKRQFLSHPQNLLGMRQRERPAYHAACVAQANAPALRGAVEFLGSLPVDRVREELGGAACLALPSLQETAPLVIAEAMACGVPVVASRACGMPYMIEEGATGFLAPPDDAALWAERLGALLASPGMRERFGARAREVARERFSAARVAERTVAVYAAVVEASRESGASGAGA